jgi:hypothetical protein
MESQSPCSVVSSPLDLSAVIKKMHQALAICKSYMHDQIFIDKGITSSIKKTGSFHIKIQNVGSNKFFKDHT